MWCWGVPPKRYLSRQVLTTGLFHLGERMEIHFNMTFPKMPCELLTLDVMDVAGEKQHGVMHGINKVRLRPQSEGGGVIDVKSLSL